MHLPAAHENGIAGRDGKVMDARFDGVVSNRAFELRARDAAREADDQVRLGCRAGDVPVLRLGLTAEFSGHRGGRVDLQTEALAAIEPFHQKGKRFSCRPARAHHVGTVLREQAPE